jgi:hypothetical protein
MVPRQKLVDLFVRMAVDDLGDDIGEVELRIDAIELTGTMMSMGRSLISSLTLRKSARRTSR